MVEVIDSAQDAIVCLVQVLREVVYYPQDIARAKSPEAFEMLDL